MSMDAIDNKMALAALFNAAQERIESMAARNKADVYDGIAVAAASEFPELSKFARQTASNIRTSEHGQLLMAQLLKDL